MHTNAVKFFLITLGSAAVVLFFLSGAPVGYAADAQPGNNPGASRSINDILSGENSGTGVLGAKFFNGVKSDPREIIREIVFVVFGFLGTLMICLILYSGFLWMSAKEKGEKDKILVAKAHLTNAIIGAVIVMSAWTISIFVLDVLKKTVQGD